MTYHYRDLGSASDRLKENSLAAQPIRSTNKIWVVTRHQYGISELVNRRRFERAQVATTRNVGYFLRLQKYRLNGILRIENVSSCHEFDQMSKASLVWPLMIGECLTSFSYCFLPLQTFPSPVNPTLQEQA